MSTSILKARVELNTTSVQKGLKNIRKGFNDIASAGVIAGAVGIAGGLAYSVKSAADFESGMAKVKTLLKDADKERMPELRKGLQDIATNAGIGAKDAVEALYQTISAGVSDPAQALQFLDQASKLAVGGFVSLEKATDAISTTMTAYGLGVDDASKISDLLFQTVRLGKTDMEKLSGSVGTFVGKSKELGVSLEETLGAFAQLTTTQESTEKSATAISSIFNQMLKPSKELKIALKKVTREFGDMEKIHE